MAYNDSVITEVTDQCKCGARFTIKADDASVQKIYPQWLTHHLNCVCPNDTGAAKPKEDPNGSAD